MLFSPRRVDAGLTLALRRRLPTWVRIHMEFDSDFAHIIQ